MPTSIGAPDSTVRLIVKPLNQEDFAPFGRVIQNPTLNRSAQAPAASRNGRSFGTDPEVVNQGTALKYKDVTEMINLYQRAPSQRSGRAVMNLFVCTPPPLAAVEVRGEETPGRPEARWSVKVLERHPFTTQTFIPLGLAPADHESRYLVIVAPSLPPSRNQAPRPPPFPRAEPRRRQSLKELLLLARPPPFPENPTKRAKMPSKTSCLAGSGLPDLQKLRAFIADGSQAVTYAAGVWHSPMMVLGTAQVAFVVVQFTNGVGLEDCQAVEISAKENGQGVFVELPPTSSSLHLSNLKAKL